MNLFRSRRFEPVATIHFGSWAQYFALNNARRAGEPAVGGETLADSERERVGASMAEFARGESSEARDFLARSAAFAQRTGDAAFHAASVAFVREENLHAESLLGFMRCHSIPPARASWGDAVFRLLRHLGDAAWSSRVLLCAEVLAQLYYPALGVATHNSALAALCDRIISDESIHLEFQSDRIAELDRWNPLWLMRLQRIAASVVFGGALVVVWFGHRPVLRQRTGFAAYALESIERFARVERVIDEKRCGAAKALRGAIVTGAIRG